MFGALLVSGGYITIAGVVFCEVRQFGCYSIVGRPCLSVLFVCSCGIVICGSLSAFRAWILGKLQALWERFRCLVFTFVVVVVVVVVVVGFVCNNFIGMFFQIIFSIPLKLPPRLVRALLVHGWIIDKDCHASPFYQPTKVMLAVFRTKLTKPPWSLSPITSWASVVSSFISSKTSAQIGMYSTGNLWASTAITDYPRGVFMCLTKSECLTLKSNDKQVYTSFLLPHPTTSWSYLRLPGWSSPPFFDVGTRDAGTPQESEACCTRRRVSHAFRVKRAVGCHGCHAQTFRLGAVVMPAVFWKGWMRYKGGIQRRVALSTAKPVWTDTQSCIHMKSLKVPQRTRSPPGIKALFYHTSHLV